MPRLLLSFLFQLFFSEHSGFVVVSALTTPDWTEAHAVNAWTALYFCVFQWTLKVCSCISINHTRLNWTTRSKCMNSAVFLCFSDDKAESRSASGPAAAGGSFCGHVAEECHEPGDGGARERALGVTAHPHHPRPLSVGEIKAFTCRSAHFPFKWCRWGVW